MYIYYSSIHTYIHTLYNATRNTSLMVMTAKHFKRIIIKAGEKPFLVLFFVFCFLSA